MTEAKDSKTGWNDYAVQPDPERSVIAELEWLEQMTDLDSLVKTKSVEEIEYILTYGELPPEGYTPEAKLFQFRLIRRDLNQAEIPSRPELKPPATPPKEEVLPKSDRSRKRCKCSSCEA